MRLIWTDLKFLFGKGLNNVRHNWDISIFPYFRVSVRILSIYSVADLGDPLNTAELNVVPSILIPHYDEGTSTLFLTGRVC